MPQRLWFPSGRCSPCNQSTRRASPGSGSSTDTSRWRAACRCRRGRDPGSGRESRARCTAAGRALVDTRREIDDDVRVAVEKRRDGIQILRVVGHMREEERRLRVRRDHAVALLQELIFREVRAVEAPPRELEQIEIVLVALVDREEEAPRIRDVDKHRQA